MYGNKNIKTLKRYNFILTVVLMMVLCVCGLIIYKDGILSFAFVLGQSFLFTLFYELFKSTLVKSANIYETYKNYYEKTILNETTLDILKFQLTNILNSKRINISSLLSFINEYYNHLNNTVFYDDESLEKVNQILKNYVLNFNKRTIKKIL